MQIFLMQYKTLSYTVKAGGAFQLTDKPNVLYEVSTQAKQ